ncbi:MAG: Na+/H+ antiporter [Candidatus Obscuribacter sp.]|nr:Na+/H+ antiporter [Candidatus Obscuribacter sp.]
MHTTPTAHGLEILMVLLLVAATVGLAIRWVKVPYSIALVIVGLLIGACHIIQPVAMTPDLILLVCLPALLFEASWNLNLKELMRNWVAVVVLAVPGVCISMLISGYILHRTCGIAFPLALLFGAMTAATDPISVLALFRKLGLNKRLSTVLEAESLFNDGTAVVLFKLVLALSLAATTPGIFETSQEFIVTVLGGALCGVAFGFAGSLATRYFDDHLLEITLTALVAYGSFLVGEQLHVSPVIAVLMAGIVIGNYGSYSHMSASTRIAVNSFWEYAAFLVNSIVFLLIGLQINFASLIANGQAIFWGVSGIMVARLIVVYALCPLINVTQKANTRISLRWQHLLFWGALRGSLSMALALSLPLDFPEREKLIVITFGVVLFTLIVPGLTIEPLVKLLNIERDEKGHDQVERLSGLLVAEENASKHLDLLKEQGTVSDEIFETLSKEIKTRSKAIGADLRSLKAHESGKEDLAMFKTRLALLEVRKESLLKLIRDHEVEPWAVESLLVDIDGKLHAMTAEYKMQQEESNG